MSRPEREAVAAILALGCGPWEPIRGHYPMGVLGEARADPKPAAAARKAKAAKGRATLFEAREEAA